MSLIFVFLLTGLACRSTRDSKPDSDALLVIFASSKGAFLIRENKKTPLKAGRLLKIGDRLQTTRYAGIDLQTRSGSVIRIREYGDIIIKNLANSLRAGEHRLHIENGGLLAKVKRAGASQKFTVTTPTSIASVRGTKFSVTVNEGRNPEVKVTEGKVAMSPRVAGLEKLSPAELEKNPELKKLAENLKKNEVVLEKNTGGKLKPGLEKKAFELDRSLKNTKDKPAPDLTESARNLNTLLGPGNSQPGRGAVETRNSPPTPQEKVEENTLIEVDRRLVDRVVESSQNTGISSAERKKTNQKLSKNIQETYEKKMDGAFLKVKKILGQKGLSSEDALRKEYNILEIVKLKDGNRKSGVVVAQAGSIIIIHSVGGVFRLRINNIYEIEYKHL